MLKRIVVLFALLAALVVPSTANAATTTSINVQSATLLNNFQVQVTGTIQCTFPDSYFVNIQVYQRGPGQANQTGSGSTSGQCTNNGPQSWIVTVTGGPFSPGKALITAFGQVCGPTGCAFDQEDQTIRLQRA
jgi:hypothetical protein